MEKEVMATGTEGTAQGDTEAGAGTGSQAAASSFIDSLPEELRGNEQLKGFDSAEKLARAHIEVLGKIKAVPENPEGYEIKIPEGKSFDEAFMGSFKTWAHQAGLSQDQASKLAEGYMAFEAQSMAAVEKQINDAREAMKVEWGAKLNENLALSIKAVDQFFTTEEKQWLDKSGMGDNPTFIKIFHKIGKAINEDAITTGGARGGARMERTVGGIPQLEFPSMQKK